MKMRVFLISCALFCLIGHKASAKQNSFNELLRSHPYQLETEQGMVVCDSPIASRIGRNVFQKGGNAVDAAVATAFAMAVTWPEAGNIGGGGFMLVRPADGKDPVCIDYRETASLACKVDTFKATDSALTRKAVGVPGTVRGLELAHKKYGKLKWRDLVMPSAKIAKEGFNVDQPLANSLNYVLGSSPNDSVFAELKKVYGKPGGGKWMAGDTMKLPELGATLEEIANNGAGAFYKGRLADLLVAEMKKGDGMVRQPDLDAYKAKIRKPIVGTFNGFEIIGAAPPSSGGICIVQALNIVEALAAEKKISNEDRYSANTMHLLAETLRRVFLDRARHLGDPDFSEIPKHLTSKGYARKLAREIKTDLASKSAALAPDIKLTHESDNTTHFSIVDPDGMAVSNTYTLEASWGSRIVVPGAGYVLNNEMGDFNWVKGLTNTRGRIGTAPNLLQPGKRMLSSQCPVIVAKDGQLRIVTGSPGGRTIISTVFSIVLNHTYFGLSGPASVTAARFHHQWMPDELRLEWIGKPAYETAIIKLKSSGHEIVKSGPQGSAHSIFVDGKRKIGIADFRRSGRAASTNVSRIACWDFDGNKGVGLDGLDSQTHGDAKWSGNISGAFVDGNENLSFCNPGKKQDVKSLADLGISGEASISIKVHLNGIRFSGKSRNETFRFGLAEKLKSGTAVTSRLTAGMFVERTDKNEVVLRGEATGDGASSIGAYRLSPNNICGPVDLRLDLDSVKDEYSIWLRRGISHGFEKIGSGTIAPNRLANMLRMSFENDFDESDYFKVDRIEVLKK